MKKKAFVLMPFSSELTEVYEHLIKGAVSEYFEVFRADDIKSQNNILEDIVTGIANSQLVVADLTDSNPNVYYELGIAHALQKKVVLITQEIEDLPFDLRSYRVIPYSLHFLKMNEAKKELAEIAKGAYENSIPFGNPVKDYALLNIGSQKVTSQSSNLTESDEQFGLLDHQIEIEEKFTLLTEIIEDVSATLVNELVPELNSATETLKNQPDMNAKERKLTISKTAKIIDGFSTKLATHNEEYRNLINDLGSNIEFVLTNASIVDEASESEVKGFLENFEEMERSALVGRDGFSGFLQASRGAPNLTGVFTRANKNMQREVESFIENIDQTISMSSRARSLGRTLLGQTLTSERLESIKEPEITND